MNTLKLYLFLTEQSIHEHCKTFGLDPDQFTAEEWEQELSIQAWSDIQS